MGDGFGGLAAKGAGGVLSESMLASFLVSHEFPFQEEPDKSLNSMGSRDPPKIVPKLILLIPRVNLQR